MNGQKGEETSKTATPKLSSDRTPEGFFEFFRSDDEVPEPPDETQKPMQLDELGISLHYSYPLLSLGISSPKDEERDTIDREMKRILPKLDQNELELIDRQVFHAGEINCSRLAYGPVNLTIGPLTNGLALQSRGYVIVTLHSGGVVIFTMTMHLTGQDTGTRLNVDHIQALEDAYFRDLPGLKVAEKATTFVDFFEQLRNAINQVAPGLPGVRCGNYVSVSIKKTTPPFENARKLVTNHPYEMIAMLGEEAHWRKTEKGTLREVLGYGMQSTVDDVSIPGQFASLEFDRSPQPADPFDRFGITAQHILDIQCLAASTAFAAIRSMLDGHTEKCANASEKDYNKLIRETNRLLSRYLRVKQFFIYVDHIWTDIAWEQYVNYQLELFKPTSKVTRTESLDGVMETLRVLTAQMDDIVRRETESRTSRALQIVGLFLSGAAILDLVKLAGEANLLTPPIQLLVGSLAWAAVVVGIYLMSFLRRVK
jgi:hypothetical protein